MIPDKKLLVLSSSYPRWLGDHEPGFIHELSKRLTDQFQVRVLCPHTAGTAVHENFEGVQVIRYRYAPDSLETLVNDGGIINNLKQQPLKWLLVPPFLFGLLWRTWREINRWRPDLIHAHWLLPQGLVVALLSLLNRQTPPFLATSHGADLFALRAWPLKFLKSIAVQKAAALTAVSHAMTTELAALGAPLDKINVLPMGVDINQRFTPSSNQPRSYDEILFVGRLVEKKGLRYLLAAMPEIIANHPSVSLTIVGFGPEESERRAQATALGIAHKVNFIGALAQTELPVLYRRAAVFVAPFIRARSGDQEGLPVTLMEAIACGCPAITGNLEAMSDLFEAEEMDMCVAPADIGMLAKRIIITLKRPDDARYRAECLRLRLSQRLSWETITQQYNTLLQNMLPSPFPK